MGFEDRILRGFVLLFVFEGWLGIEGLRVIVSLVLWKDFGFWSYKDMVFIRKDIG